MKTFSIYMEFFGKRMKHTLMARNEIEARRMVRERLNIIKTEEVIAKNDTLDFLMDILNGKK